MRSGVEVMSCYDYQLGLLRASFILSCLRQEKVNPFFSHGVALNLVDIKLGRRQWSCDGPIDLIQCTGPLSDEGFVLFVFGGCIAPFDAVADFVAGEQRMAQLLRILLDLGGMMFRMDLNSSSWVIIMTFAIVWVVMVLSYSSFVSS